MIIQTRTRNFEKLLYLFVCQFTISFNTLFRMTFHIVGPCYCSCVFLLPQQKYVIQTSMYLVQQLFHLVCIHVEYIPNFHGQEMIMFVKINVFSSISSTWKPSFCFFPVILMSSTHTDRKKNLVSDERTYIPNLVLFPIQVFMKLPPIVFLITIRQMDDHINSVQEVPLDLQCLPMILAICVVESVSTHLDIRI